MPDLQEMEEQLKAMIIAVCNIPDPPRNFSSDTPLIGPDSPLGLDSLDAVEIVVAVQKTFDVLIGGEQNSRAVLQSIGTLAAYISQEQPADVP